MSKSCAAAAVTRSKPQAPVKADPRKYDFMAIPPLMKRWSSTCDDDDVARAFDAKAQDVLRKFGEGGDVVLGELAADGQPGHARARHHDLVGVVAVEFARGVGQRGALEHEFA